MAWALSIFDEFSVGMCWPRKRIHRVNLCVYKRLPRNFLARFSRENRYHADSRTGGRTTIDLRLFGRCGELGRRRSGTQRCGDTGDRLSWWPKTTIRARCFRGDPYGDNRGCLRNRVDRKLLSFICAPCADDPSRSEYDSLFVCRRQAYLQ